MQNTINEKMNLNSVTEKEQNVDTCLASLVMIAKFHGVAADPDQIKHAFAIGEEGISEIDILRAAKELGFKARAVNVGYERLKKLKMPAMVEIEKSSQPSAFSGQEKSKEQSATNAGEGEKDKNLSTKDTNGHEGEKDRQEAIGEGGEKANIREGEMAKGEGTGSSQPSAVGSQRKYVILAKIEGEQVLILDPAKNKPEVLNKEEFLERWIRTGERQKAKGEGEKDKNLSTKDTNEHEGEKDRQKAKGEGTGNSQQENEKQKEETTGNKLKAIGKQLKDRLWAIGYRFHGGQKTDTEETGRVILLSHRKDSILGSEEIFGIKWFIPAVWKYRKPLTEVLIASLVLQIFALITPIFMQVVIDKVLVHRGLTTLDVLAIGLLAIALFETVLMVLRTYLFTHTTSRIDVTLGTKLFKHLFALPLRYFEVRRVGDTIARVRELENIRQFLTGTPLTSLLDVVFMFLFIGVMFFYSTTLTFVALAALPFFAGLSAFVTPMLRHRLDERFNKGADAHSYLVEAVSGVQTVKSFALEPEAQKKWEGLLSSYIRASFKTYQLSGTAGALGQFINRTSYLLILWFGAHLVMDGKLTVGQLIAFQMLSARVSDPVLRLVQMWQDFQQAGLSIKRLGDILNTKPEPSVDSTKARLPAIRGHVKLEGVRFRYRVDGSEVLRNVSFDIEPGTVAGIVGRSGSGKSTLAKLIQRLYIPEAGKILVDGVDIALADPAWLRRQIGVVLQENFLFNNSVRDNIAIHYPSASMTDVVKVAQLAGAHDFVLELPEGYDTMVGEKGTALSGGQKQRIAIARALLTNPRLLIFDEATSALDYESERIIQNNLKKICEERTVLIIAHRLSTLRDAHRILVIDRGELVEHGSHEELLTQKGLYHYLFSQQMDGREK